MKFIELTVADKTEIKINLNINHIQYFNSHPCGAIVYNSDSDYVEVKETAHEIRNKINLVGGWAK